FDDEARTHRYANTLLIVRADCERKFNDFHFPKFEVHHAPLALLGCGARKSACYTDPTHN
ncbi:MAG TPA: hypothetical protein VGF45_20525, partial [Polyangia bacterium]